MYYSEGPNDPLIFKQRDDGIYYGCNGYKIVEGKDYILYDKEGKEIGRCFFNEFEIEGRSVRLLPLKKLKGRNPNSIKFCSHHFTPGTVFRVDPSVARDGVDTFTVKSVYNPVPDSIIIETTTPHPEIGEDVFRSFNVQWVVEIIYRAPGKMPKSSDSLYGGYVTCDGLQIPFNDSPEMAFSYISSEKLVKRLLSMGLIRKTWHRQGFIFDHRFTSVKKRKKAHTFLRKNLHLVKLSVKESKTQYEAMIEEMYDRDDWSDSHLD